MSALEVEAKVYEGLELFEVEREYVSVRYISGKIPMVILGAVDPHLHYSYP